jgi:hypothetical protein
MTKEEKESQGNVSREFGVPYNAIGILRKPRRLYYKLKDMILSGFSPNNYKSLKGPRRRVPLVYISPELPERNETGGQTNETRDASERDDTAA